MPEVVSQSVGEMPDKPCHLGYMKVSPPGRTPQETAASAGAKRGRRGILPLGRRELVLGLRPPPPGLTVLAPAASLCPQARTHCSFMVLLTASCLVLPIPTPRPVWPLAVVLPASPSPSPTQGDGEGGEREAAEGRAASVPGACDGPRGDWKGGKNKMVGVP